MACRPFITSLRKSERAFHKFGDACNSRSLPFYLIDLVSESELASDSDSREAKDCEKDTFSMESVLSPVSGGSCHSMSRPLNGLGQSKRGSMAAQFNSCSFGGKKSRRMVLVRAEPVGINPDIRKTEEKVVDSVVVTELSKPLTAYCRCWRSRTFPLCDGSHVKHNKATGDNVGPLLLKK